MGSMDNRPLTYFWVAEYSDGSALPQFDPKTGKENLFSRVDHTRLVRFGWYPFTPEMARKVFEAEGVHAVPTNNSPHVIELKDGEKLIAHRTNTIRFSISGGVSRHETVYMLGKAGGQVTRISEHGKVKVRG